MTEDAGQTSVSGPGPGERLSARFQGTLPHDVLQRLKKVGFGERIVAFGAEMLLSVLPIIILLSSFANTRIDDDVARHLGLNGHGAEIVSTLFRHPGASFNVGIVLALLLSLVGTISVASSVQVVYERTFSLPHLRGASGILRCAIWAGTVGVLLIADANVSTELHSVPGSSIISSVVDAIALSVFFWWTAHFLLGGRERWRRLVPSAIVTSLCFVGLGFFSSFYFSEAIITDSRLYGTIGVVLSLVTWFIAIGAVICIGAVVGAVLDERRRPATS